MQSEVVNTEPIELAIPSGQAEPPLYRSRYGGLWVDRRDAHDLLEGRLARGEVTDADAQALAHYIDYGYVVFPKVVDESVIDEYAALFEGAWDSPPDGCWLQWKQQALPMDRKFYDEVAKVGSLHLWFDRAAELIFPPPVLRFLTQIYERPPVTFQTLTMRKGSEEPLHTDTGPLTLTEPMSLVGSWLALEDVRPHSGEFQFVPGSHRAPELLHHGTDKGHHGDHDEYYKILTAALDWSKEHGSQDRELHGKEGRCPHLARGPPPWGSADRGSDQNTQEFHRDLMPLGVMPLMFNFSRFSAVPYAEGGYTLDALWSDMVSSDDSPPQVPDTVRSTCGEIGSRWHCESKSHRR